MTTETAVTLREQFDQQGYAVCPGVLDADQIESIRGAISEAMGNDWYLNQTFRFPEIAALLEHDPFIEPLRAIFGENFVFTPEVTALGHYFGPWHRDTDAHQRVGLRFHFDEDFRMGTCVIYMCDNHPEYAGGLDLIPRTSSMPTWQDAPESITVPTKAGDMLVFDTRLQHKATSPKVDPNEVPAEHRKSGIYFTVGSNVEHAQAYRDFLASRPDEAYAYLKTHHYPVEVTQTARERGITLIP